MKKSINLKDAYNQYDRIIGEQKHRYYHPNDNADKRRERMQALEAELREILRPVTAELDEVQKRCSARCISAEQIIDTLYRIQTQLGISKKAMNGIWVDVDINAQTFPGAYKGIPESTRFVAEFKNGTWRLTDVKRERTRTHGRAIIHHTDASRQAILDRFSSMESV